jgi:ribosomal protein L11 methylase PrmA
VLAVDHEALGVEAARANAEHNGVELDLVLADLLELEPPPAPTIAANVPPAVHLRLGAGLPGAVRHVIVSGIAEHALEDAVAAYSGLRAVRALTGGGWGAALLVRDG